MKRIVTKKSSGLPTPGTHVAKVTSVATEIVTAISGDYSDATPMLVLQFEVQENGKNKKIQDRLALRGYEKENTKFLFDSEGSRIPSLSATEGAADRFAGVIQEILQKEEIEVADLDEKNCIIKPNEDLPSMLIGQEVGVHIVSQQTPIGGQSVQIKRYMSIGEAERLQSQQAMLAVQEPSEGTQFGY